jgi:DNA repair protein RadC
MPPKLPAIHNAGDIYSLFRRLKDRKTESVYALFFNGDKQLTAYEEISRGGTSCVNAYPHQVYGLARKRKSRSVILVHNHPSGNPGPDLQDLVTYGRLKKDGLQFGIELADCVIIGRDSYYSFREAGLMEGYKENKQGFSLFAF